MEPSLNEDIEVVVHNQLSKGKNMIIIRTSWTWQCRFFSCFQIHIKNVPSKPAWEVALIHKVICSVIIEKVFQNVGYPIVPALLSESDSVIND